MKFDLLGSLLNFFEEGPQNGCMRNRVFTIIFLAFLAGLAGRFDLMFFVPNFGSKFVASHTPSGRIEWHFCARCCAQSRRLENMLVPPSRSEINCIDG